RGYFLGLSILLTVLPAVEARAQNTVELLPAQVSVSPGGALLLDLAVDFAEPSLGGGVVVDFDPTLLGFVGFDWDPGAPDDPALRLVCPSADPACADFPGPGILIAFAVDTISFPAISGAHVLGTFELQALSAGTASVSLSEDESVAGPLVGVGSFQTPSLVGATVIIATPAVPALHGPAAALLIASLSMAGARLSRPHRAHRPDPRGMPEGEP
ncbi:MAG TPA: hypothetical protein VKA74_11605, partial [Myxococcota bacterium]|nr:hypothetical protein [Myxococcota bacterium]